MAILQFPDDTPRGVLAWVGSYSEETGPVLAFGTVEVPDDQPISLDVHSATGLQHNAGGGWSSSGSGQPSDLGFLRDLPEAVISALSFQKVVASSVPAIEHLAPGMERLTLKWSGLDDTALPSIAKLTGLMSLQTFGNRFTDEGVQQLASLTNLDRLWLEEETLTVEGFRFMQQLPRLRRLGLMDVRLQPGDLERLRAEAPSVDVST